MTRFLFFCLFLKKPNQPEAWKNTREKEELVIHDKLSRNVFLEHNLALAELFFVFLFFFFETIIHLPVVTKETVKFNKRNTTI